MKDDFESTIGIEALIGGGAISCLAFIGCICKDKNDRQSEGGNKEIKKIYKRSIKKDERNMRENLV